ncbi:hypothetical protein V5O48_002155 [Marasmius crinis-equi]|uniref:Uncharacterized protein n=1 Tax=Marasmius crinis-equi TaxID=585013 RepID=A0ABR3FXJ6_9AGAR
MNRTSAYPKHLDLEKARWILNEIEELQTKNGTVNPHLTDVRNLSFWPADIRFTKTGSPLSWRIVRATKDDEIEEVVFKVHGVVKSKMLPPQRNPIGKSTPRYLTQSVTIAGLGQMYFKDAIDAIIQVNTRLGLRVGHENMEPCSVTKIDEDQECVVTASNRYFTAKKYAEHLDIIEFPDSIDPKGHLKRAASGQYVYTPENVVQYERRTVYAESDERYEPVEPQEIVVGAIVELQITFMAVETNATTGRFRTTAVLRAVTILDDSTARDAILREQHAIIANASLVRPTAPTVPLLLKRRNGNVPGLYKKIQSEGQYAVESEEKGCSSRVEMMVEQGRRDDDVVEGVEKKQKKD